MQSQVTFFNQPLDQLIQHLLELRAFILAFVLVQHLLNLVLAKQSLIHKRLKQSASQRIKRSILRHSLTSPIVIVVVSGVEQRIRQTFHQVAKVERPNIEAIEFSVASKSHGETESG